MNCKLQADTRHASSALEAACWTAIHKLMQDASSCTCRQTLALMCPHHCLQPTTPGWSPTALIYPHHHLVSHSLVMTTVDGHTCCYTSCTCSEVCYQALSYKLLLCTCLVGTGSCAQLRARGKCSASYMTSPSDPHAAAAGGYCAVTCGRCTAGTAACVDRPVPGGLSGGES